MERTTSAVFIFTHYCKALSALLHTVYIWLNAAAFIKFSWFECGVYLKSKHVFVLVQKAIFKSFSISRFTYYYITAIHNVNKESMSVMLPRHQNWYIQKDLRLVHTKFSSVIEVFITVCFWVYYSNKRRVMMRRLFEGGVYLYFSSKLRCLVGAAFNRIITVCSEFEIYQIFCWRLVSSTIQDGGKCGHFG